MFPHEVSVVSVADALVFGVVHAFAKRQYRMQRHRRIDANVVHPAVDLGVDPLPHLFMPAGMRDDAVRLRDAVEGHPDAPVPTRPAPFEVVVLVLAVFLAQRQRLSYHSVQMFDRR
ncbi:hypothetical protein OMP38_17855 [Cohnella ginsengisoli]|uniref:Uncharacterized protein n=1 Tax=Cohnella ginsengisoli TaxID=425004 RepID=A0A9X4QPA9_9BACL|nr:hypothetical protein [Cohnella ginsengisoli]MDG0792530.1 hypothetical protein [Cohnella ginsengisoli]